MPGSDDIAHHGEREHRDDDRHAGLDPLLLLQTFQLGLLVLRALLALLALAFVRRRNWDSLA